LLGEDRVSESERRRGELEARQRSAPRLEFSDDEHCQAMVGFVVIHNRSGILEKDGYAARAKMRAAHQINIPARYLVELVSK